MRKFLCVISCMMACFSTAQAGSWYVRGSGGANFIDGGENFDIAPGYYVGGSLGYRFSRFFRLEGEGAYRHNKLNKLVVETVEIPVNAPLRTWSAMGNAFVDLPCCSFLFPYIGGGVGALWIRSADEFPVQSGSNTYLLRYRIADNRFGYQGIAGLGVPFGQWGAITADYRYLNGEDTRANHTVGMSLILQF